MTAKGHIEIPTALAQDLRSNDLDDLEILVDWMGKPFRVENRSGSREVDAYLATRLISWARDYADGCNLRIDLTDMEARREEQSGFYQLVEVD